MAKRSRALLTDHDRDVLQDNLDVDDEVRWEKHSRIRKRIDEEFVKDLEIFLEEKPEFYFDVLEAAIDTGRGSGKTPLLDLAHEKPELFDTIRKAVDEAADELDQE